MRATDWLDRFTPEQRHAHAMQQAALRNEHRRSMHRRKSDAGLQMLLSSIRFALASGAEFDLRKAEAVLAQALGERS